MAAEKRVYIVGSVDQQNEGAFVNPELVRAGSQAQAIRHVVRGKYHAKVADQDDLIGLLNQGVKVQDAGEEA